MTKRTLDWDGFAAMYRDGHSLNAISRAYGVNDENVRYALKRMRVSMRPRGAQPGDGNHQFKGGTRTRKDGYVVNRGSRAKPHAHRVIAEAALGRPLRANEVVHHINGDRGDNRPANLLICTTRYHTQLHARIRAKYGTGNYPFNIEGTS